MEKIKYLYSFFSNNIETLSYSLNNHLFTADSQPFDRRWIIVPNIILKYWLKNKLTTFNKQSLSMGVSIISLEEFFKEIFHLFPFIGKTKKLFLTDNLLPFIYKELKNTNSLEKNNPQTFQDFSKNFAITTYSNILSLIPVLKKYYFYNINEETNLNWQLDLWNKIKKNFYSIKEVFSIISNFLSKKLFSCSIFFFCPEYFSTDLLYFINEISSFYNVFTYHLSPCAEFWGDIISDQQISYIQTKFNKFKVNKNELKTWFSLVTDRNPLLANLGQLEKKCFNQIEALDPIFINEHTFPKDNHNLAKIQKDILNLSIPSEPLNDESISIHVCTNIRREVEILFNNITILIKKEQPLLSDIFIGTSNLSLYEPYLSTIFSNIPLNIIGKSNSHAFSLLEKISLIKDIFKNNLCFNSILSLFSHKDFLIQMNLDEEEASFLISWLQAHPFFYNNEKQFDWELSLDKLINDYPSFNYNNSNSYFELIGKINLWILSLKEALDKILNSPYQTLITWFHETTNHLNIFFSISEEEQLILHSLEKYFSDLTNFSKEDPLLYELSFFLDFFIDKISSKKEEIKHPFIRNTIHCGNLKDLSLLPKKYFFILGLQIQTSKESSFIEEANSFQIPSELEKENQIILNSLITTQKSLTISYISDLQLQNPPVFGVDEIKKYIHATKIFYHPNKNYSYKYFSQEASNLYLDTVHEDLSYLYKLSLQTYSKKEKNLDFFSQNNIFIEKDSEINCIQTININNILISLTNPLYHFLSSKMNYFSLKQQTKYSKPRFFITKKEKTVFLNKLLEQQNAIFPLKNQPFLSSQFSKLAEEELLDLYNSFKEKFNYNEIKKIIFSNNHVYPQVTQNTIFLPPICLNINKIKISITGTIHGFLNDTILVLENLTLESITKILPSIALIKKAQQEFQEIIPIKEIQFLSKTISMKNFSQDYLSDLLKYYLLSQKKPSPLFLTWLKSILNSDKENLQKDIDSTIKKDLNNPLLLSIFTHRNPPTASFILENWYEEAKKLFPIWEEIKEEIKNE